MATDGDQPRRRRLGIMGGVAFDPELASIGVFLMLGPVFTPNLTLRPSVELAIGEVTTLIALHVDALYSIAESRGSPGPGGARRGCQVRAVTPTAGWKLVEAAHWPLCLATTASVNAVP